MILLSEHAQIFSCHGGDMGVLGEVQWTSDVGAGVPWSSSFAVLYWPCWPWVLAMTDSENVETKPASVT